MHADIHCSLPTYSVARAAHSLPALHARARTAPGTQFVHAANHPHVNTLAHMNFESEHEAAVPILVATLCCVLLADNT
eukprot:6177632-Pleurochrysis_carterae.AAC.1